jgi:hypothetical protein
VVVVVAVVVVGLLDGPPPPRLVRRRLSSTRRPQTRSKRAPARRGQPQTAWVRAVREDVLRSPASAATNAPARTASWRWATRVPTVQSAEAAEVGSLVRVRCAARARSVAVAWGDWGRERRRKSRKTGEKGMKVWDECPLFFLMIVVVTYAEGAVEGGGHPPSVLLVRHVAGIYRLAGLIRHAR